MRRIALLALAACMALCAPALSESENRVDTLAAIVSHALDDAGYTYTYDDVDDLITTSFSLESTLGYSDIKIYLYTDGFLFKAFSPVYAADEYMMATSEYLGRANTGLLVGDFEMNYDTGAVWYKVYLIAEDSFPGYGDVLRALNTCLDMLEVYGDGLSKVALTGYDPATAIAEAQAAY